jgi:hypothetical protein
VRRTEHYRSRNLRHGGGHPWQSVQSVTPSVELRIFKMQRATLMKCEALSNECLFWDLRSLNVVGGVRLGRVANWNALKYSRLSIY